MSLRAPALFAFACIGCFVSACSPDVTIATNPTAEPKPVPWQPSTPEARAIECSPLAASDPDRTILAFADGTDVVFESVSGDRKVVHTFSEGAFAPWIQVVARGGYVAAIASSATADGTPIGEAILLTRDGDVVWSTSGATGFETLQLGETGILAVGTSLGSTLLVAPSGSVATIEGISPAGPPDASGRFAVMLTPGVYVVEYGFFDPTEGVTPLSAPAASSWATVNKTAIDYLSVDADGNLSLVHETPDTFTSMKLPAIAPDPFLASATEEGVALVRTSEWTDDGSLVNHDFFANAGTGSFVNVTPAPGVATFGTWYYQGAALGDEGEALLVARNASSGGVFRSLDHGANWQLVGQSFRNITDISINAKSGTYVVVGADTVGYFPMDPWSIGDADIDGVGAFVARPSDGVVRSIPALTTRSALTEDGACVAFVADGSLGVIDVGSGVTTELGAIADDAMPVWVE